MGHVGQVGQVGLVGDRFPRPTDQAYATYPTSEKQP
jgi:hypothetical protein